MAITVNYPLDELVLDNLIAQGYTTLKLYYSNTVEGPYSDSSISPSPSTLADILSAGAPYSASFSFASGNGGQWFKVLAYDGGSTSSINDAQAFHGGGGTTLATLRQRTGKLMGILLTGTTTSAGSTSTAICTNARFKRYRDHFFGGGTGVDGWFFNNLTNSEWSVISDWTQSSGTFSISPTMTNSNASGNTFEVMARFSPEDYRDAINWAIATAYPTLSKPVVDTNTLTVDDVFVYPVPFNIRILNKVEIEQADTNLDSTNPSSRGQPWRQISYMPVDDGLVRSVEFKTELDDGRRIRFTGTSMLSQMYNDSDYTEIIDPQIDLITYLAAHRLYTQLINTDAASDTDKFQQLAGYYQSLWETHRARHATRRKSKRIWAHDPMWNTY